MRRCEGGTPETVTIVFTDIVGSSTLAERLGDRAWLRLLVAHGRSVRAAARRHGGRIVKSQGDGFMIEFASPRAAFACAAAIQRPASPETRSAPRLDVRCGIHTGPIVRDRGDLFGKSVIVAARLTAGAHGGEILASSDAAEAAGLAQTLAPQQMDLKGLSGTFTTYRFDASWVPQTPIEGRRVSFIKQIALSLR